MIKMKSPSITPLLFIMALLVVVVTNAQPPKIIKDSTSFKAVRGYRGETLVVQCDTVYVLNKFSFKTYNDVYENRPVIDSVMTETVKTYDRLLVLGDSQSIKNEFYYQDLLKQFNLLADSSSTFADKNVKKIQNATATLDRATEDIVQAQKLLSDTQKLLAKERANRVKRDLGIGIGGIVVGILVGLIFAK
jgi:ElaB/YqjD/DUF883 family membrane-anchored ribosome-binding protein